jgi:hypothetical protein
MQGEPAATKPAKGRVGLLGDTSHSTPQNPRGVEEGETPHCFQRSASGHELDFKRQTVTASIFLRLPSTAQRLCTSLNILVNFGLRHGTRAA